MSIIKFAIFLILTVSGLLLFCPDSFSAGAPLECVITIKSVQLKKDSGEWITVIQPDHQVDLVSQEPIVSFFNNGRRVPAGKYKNFRIVLSETVKVSGADGKNRTRTGGWSVVGGSATDALELPGRLIAYREISPTWTNDPAVQGRATFELNLNNEDTNDEIQISGREDFDRDLAVKEHSVIHVGFGLDLAGTLHYSGSEPWDSGIMPAGVMYFLPPKEVKQATISVDEQKISLSNRDIRMAF